MSALNTVKSLAIKLSGIMKGSQYMNTEGKIVVLDEKDKIAKSKKELRNGAAIVLRENSSRSMQILHNFSEKSITIKISTAELYEKILKISDTLESLMGPLLTNNKAARFAQDIFIILSEEFITEEINKLESKEDNN